MPETLLLLPLYLALVFAVIQIGQLGTALVMTNYAASKIARKAVRDGVSGASGPANLGAYNNDFKDAMIAGMDPGALEGCISGSPGDPTRDITVRATAQVNAMPFFGHVLHRTLRDRYDDSSGGRCSTDPSQSLVSANALGPFNFSGSAPYRFMVRGRATARMNLAPSS